jgi:hypothetical protein
LPPASIVLLRGLISYPEDGGKMFLRNFRLCPKYTALQPSSLHIGILDDGDDGHKRSTEILVSLKGAANRKKGTKGLKNEIKQRIKDMKENSILNGYVHLFKIILGKRE